MPTTPTLAQSTASRQNGARSAGPATTAGKERSSHNSVRHGLSGRTFFLLPDEDPAEFREHEAMWLAAWSPRDLHEHAAASCVIRAMWRAIRADRLEAQVLTDLFAAGAIADETERQAAKATRPSRPSARCCATAAGSTASMTAPWRNSRTCASAARPMAQPDRANPTRRLNHPPPWLRPGLPQVRRRL